MSPYRWKPTGLVYFFIIEHTGKPMEHDQSYFLGLRPVISLKEGTSVSSGNGTPTNPYVIK